MLVKKKIFIFIYLLTCSLFFTLKISAVTLGNVYGHKMTGGIGNVSIYIDNKTHPYATYYQRLIKNAVTNWDNTGFGLNKFEYVYVSTSNGSKIDIYNRYCSYFGKDSSNVLASTSFYNSSEIKVDQHYYDWYSATINLNDDVLSLDTVSNAAATGTFAHEIGHAFGLAHNNSIPNSIMCPTGAGRTVNTIQLIDHNTLNSLY